jgi:hypothetical protein
MQRILVPLLLFLSLFRPGFAEEGNGSYVDITIEFSSLFPGYVQIKDEECALSSFFECEKAAIRLRREDCRRPGQSPECAEAGEILATSTCIPGLIYEGTASRGDKVTVSVCKSSGGFGNISVRNLRNGLVWTRYFLLTDGNTVRYP